MARSAEITRDLKNRTPGPGTELRIARRDGAVRDLGGDRSPSLRADLDRLFEAHRGRVRVLCLRMVGDEARAEELVQEALLVAYRQLPDFDGRARFGTWIYGIARNLCLNAVRKRGELLSEDGVVEVGDGARDVLRGLQREERLALVRRVVSRTLDGREQEVAHLRYVEEVPLARIDGILGLGGSGSRAVLQRSRRKLTAALRRELEALGHGESLLRSGG